MRRRLALSAVTDSSGVYTIRNITGGTYTLRASLQGFKEFVQTGIPITAGSAARINGKLEIGALSESVTVTTDAALLKTDKQDVSTELKPADVVNLPLNQYRNYQYLMNLVPGATPPEFQTRRPHTRTLAVGQRQRDEPQQQRHGASTAPPAQVGDEIMRAMSRGLKRLRRECLDQQLRRGAGMTGGAALQCRLIGTTRCAAPLLPPTADEFNAVAVFRLRPRWIRARPTVVGRSVAQFEKNKLFYLGPGSATASTRASTAVQRPDRQDASRRLQRVVALTQFRIYDPKTARERANGVLRAAILPADRTAPSR